MKQNKNSQRMEYGLPPTFIFSEEENNNICVTQNMLPWAEI